MSTAFEPRLDILAEPQRELWPELDAVPPEFVMYGGTALALHLGHRMSDDFENETMLRAMWSVLAGQSKLRFSAV